MATQTSHDSSVTTQTSVESVNNECKSVRLYVCMSGCYLAVRLSVCLLLVSLYGCLV